MIELKKLSKYYNSSGLVSVGLRNVDLTLHKNEIVAIVGDSGSGKSTLLNVICCVDTYEDGEMYFNGEETSHFSQNDMDLFRKNHVGFIFQNYNIIDSYTVLENVMLPLTLRGFCKNDAKKRALELLEEVGLSHRVNNRGSKLSGGEKQRCVIARALASDCSILACDEPTGNLDSKSSIEIIELIKKVAKDKLVLIVTHNFEEVADIVTRKIKVSDGMIVEDHVIQPNESSEKFEMITDGEHIQKRDLLKVSTNNIKCTPRKTVFTFFVFFCISLVAFYLYLTCMGASEKSVFNPDKSFGNCEYNRLIAFNFDHSGLSDEYKKVQGEYYENAFYEDLPFQAQITKDDNVKSFDVIYTQYNNLGYELILGEELSNDNEFFIVVPKDELDKYSLVLTPIIDGDMQIGEKTLKFVGFGSSQYVNSPTIISTENLVKDVCGITYRKIVDFTLDQGDYTEKIITVVNSTSGGNVRLLISENLRPYFESGKFEITYYLKSLYEIKSFNKEVEIFYTTTYNLVNLMIPVDCEYNFGDVYEVSLYADKPNDASNQLEKLGYTVIRPSIFNSEFDQNYTLFVIYVVASTMIVFTLGFIANTILLRVYNSKIKQYTVFRSLGVVKKEMNLIVLFEFLIIALAAILFAYISIYTVNFVFNFEFLDVIKYNNLLVSSIYFIMMLLFVLFVVSKFNKRLYTYSLQSTFKVEVSNHD